jgi:hypothetical protein
MVVEAVLVGILGLVCIVSAGRWLRWLHRMRKVSDVTGTVVARERQFTGRSYWTYPVVEFTTRDGTQIRRMFRQIARPTIGRKLRIVYDPSTLPDGRTRSTRGGLTLTTRPPVIYTVWLLLWLWLLTASGLAFLALCIVGVATAAA